MAETDPFDLCDAVFGVLTDPKPNSFPISGYEQPGRTVVAVWHFTGVIENSGLGGLIGRDVVGDSDFSHLIECFDRIQVTDAVSAIRDAVDLVRLPDGTVPDFQRRRDHWEGLAEEKRDRYHYE